MPLYGPKWPLARGNKDTYQLYSEIKPQVGFYLKNLILTSPGENISDHLYGVGLRRFLFQNNTRVAREEIKRTIRDQIAIYLPYLRLRSVEVSSDPEEIDSNYLRIKIVYSIPEGVENEVFELSTGVSSDDIGFY